VVLETTRQGQARVEDGTITTYLREALRIDASWPIFVPVATYVSDGRRMFVHLMEGYVFVASGLPETSYFDLAWTGPYIRRVLTTNGPNGMRVLSTLPNSKIKELQAKLQASVSEDITPGMRVTVTAGTYAALSGDVVDTDKEAVYIRIILRSINILTRISRLFVKPAVEEE